MVRFWTCTLGGCLNAAAIDIGSCERCRSMYCAGHIDSALHTCEKDPLDDDAWLEVQTTELVALHQKTDDDALIQRATELSGGLKCRLDEQDVLGRQKMGGMHVHREILFEDGSVWLARILRENYTSFDDELSNEILLSECATLRWLELLDIPTPRLHGFGLRGDPNNEVGNIAYMLIDKLPGRPFDLHAASEQQRAKVFGQWAEILCTLSRNPIQKIGSLQFAADDCKTISVGPVAGDRTGTLPRIGPFTNAGDFYAAWADAYLDLIADDGQLFSRYSVDAYLMFRFLREQVRAGSAWLSRWDETLSSGPFFLKHADDKGDHILVDDDYNITGIIDWTFARAVPAYDAFGPSLVTASTGDLFDGKPGLSEDDRVLSLELQRQGALFCFFKSDEMRRLFFGLGMGLDFSRDEAVAAFRCIVATFDDAIPDWHEWRKASLERWKDEPRLLKLTAKQGIPRFATCSFVDCDRSSVRGRSCQTCRRHLCAVHILAQHHRCPSTSLVDDATREKDVNEDETLLARINVTELTRRASSLRQGGVRCSFRPGKHLGNGATMGRANYHAWIDFEDGIRWLARIPRMTAFSDIPDNLVDYLIESEYATLRFLESLNVPTPRAHDFGLSTDPENLVGVAFILEDAMPGHPFYAHEATEEQKQHVYRQYADFLGEIWRHPRDQACSLIAGGQGGTVRAGPIASNRFLSLGKYGPFANPLQYFSSIADLHLDLVADGQIYPEYPKEAFLFYRLLQQRASEELAAQTNATTGFFLKHVNDKGDHLLVDEHYNITAVIDWQFARFVPACEAFGPSLFTADMGRLYGGVAGLNEDDRCLADILQQKGDGALSKWACGSELCRRFHFGLASSLSKDEAIALIGALVSLIGDTLSEDELQQWIEREWHRAAVDSRRDLVEKLLAEL